MKANVESQTFNGRVEWALEGEYFKLLTAAAALRLELYQGGALKLLAPAVRAGFYQRVGFDRVVITNTGAQLTEFLTAPDEGGSDAFTANSVITSPLDADNADAEAALGAGGLVAVAARLKGYNGATFDRLRADDEGAGAGALRVARFADAIVGAGKAFHGGCVVAAAGAGNFSHVQLKNPVASGVFVYVDRLTFGASVASTVHLRRIDGDLATDVGAGTNKDAGAAAAGAHIRSQAPAALQGTFIGALICAVNSTVTLDFNPPIRLAAGEGVGVAENGGNVALAANWQWREKAA